MALLPISKGGKAACHSISLEPTTLDRNFQCPSLFLANISCNRWSVQALRLPLAGILEQATAAWVELVRSGMFFGGTRGTP